MRQQQTKGFAGIELLSAILFCFVLVSAAYLVGLGASHTDNEEDDNSTTTLTNEEQFKTLDRWYLDAESNKYAIYRNTTLNQQIVSIWDKQEKILLSPDESCEVPISDKDKATASDEFYNGSVGLLYGSSYKSLQAVEGSDEVFEQTVLNAGCTSSEGSILVQTNPDEATASCEISVAYKSLGC